MNLYFLVEGTTESEFYPKFINYYFNDQLKRVEDFSNAVNNNYFLIGSEGYPFIYTGPKFPEGSYPALKSAILDINTRPVYDYLIVCLDADEVTVSERIIEFREKIEGFKQEGVTLNKACEFKLIVQNRCIETWFLGNRKIYKHNPTSEPLISYVKYYNVKADDPELMGNYSDDFTHQDFHLQYLRSMLRERRLGYKKELPETIVKENYMLQLQKRVNDKGQHLKTLKDFFDFCDYVKANIS
jgi:hypothetical protein